MPSAIQLSGLYTDRYELAMAAAYCRDGRADEPAVFDYFFRSLPYGGGYAVFAGLGTLLEALPEFRFSGKELDFLEKDGFAPSFLNYLERFQFAGSIWAPAEGSVVFPLEPIVRVEAPLVAAQIIETLLLNVLNFQTLVATKAARCRQAAGGRALSEFGMRRAQGVGSMWASRAACIGGFDSTSNMAAAHAFNLKPAGTMAHSFIQSYADELAAFRKYAAVHGSATVLLLDTYDTLRSGLPHAITVARELRAEGKDLLAVRLDSGDLAFLAREVRRALDAAGLQQVRIVASNQLDEYVIRSLIQQDAPIDIFGVGTALATGAPDAALDGVYKLAMIRDEPRMKASESVAKSTFPGRKSISRLRDNHGMLRGDVIHLEDEPVPTVMVHPHDPVQELDLSAWKPEPLLHEVMRQGKVTTAQPTVDEIAESTRKSLQSLPAEHLRFENPHDYKVGVSPRLRQSRDDWLTRKRKEIEK